MPACCTAVPSFSRDHLQMMCAISQGINCQAHAGSNMHSTCVFCSCKCKQSGRDLRAIHADSRSSKYSSEPSCSSSSSSSPAHRASAIAYDRIRTESLSSQAVDQAVSIMCLHHGGIIC